MAQKGHDNRSMIGTRHIEFIHIWGFLSKRWRLTESNLSGNARDFAFVQNTMLRYDRGKNYFFKRKELSSNIHLVLTPSLERHKWSNYQSRGSRVSSLNPFLNTCYSCNALSFCRRI